MVANKNLFVVGYSIVQPSGIPFASPDQSTPLAFTKVPVSDTSANQSVVQSSNVVSKKTAALSDGYALGATKTIC